MKRCRHELHSWLIGGGHYEWCYVCGALRRMVSDGTTITNLSRWIKPVGEDGKNPYELFEKNLKRKREI